MEPIGSAYRLVGQKEDDLLVLDRELDVVALNLGNLTAIGACPLVGQRHAWASHECSSEDQIVPTHGGLHWAEARRPPLA